MHMAGLAASLKTNPAMHIARIYPDSTEARQTLDEFAPDAVIFDLAESHSNLVISLLRERADLLLLGVDPSSDEMLVLSGHPERALSMQDLARVLNALPGSKNRPARAPDLARQWQFASAKMALLPTRQRKLVFALAGIVGCVVLITGLVLASPSATVPLAGTALSSDMSLLIGLAFGVGIALGGVIIGLFFWLCGHKQRG
jgi:hypothetical protein